MSLIVEAMVQTLMEQVFTALRHQAEFALDFSKQFQQLRTRLDLTKVFLATTESLNHKNNVVNTALLELREVIYEADDVVTDCLLRNQYRNDGSCGSCPGFLLQDPLFLHRTSSKLRDIMMQMKQIVDNLSTYLRAPDNIPREDAYQARVMKSQDWKPTEIIGLDSDVEKIKGWIFNTNKALHLVGIVGMGGLGKTTTAQKIFHDEAVLSRFNKMIWVCVSHSFNEERIMRSILERLEENVSNYDPTQIFSKIQEVLKDKTCLIVLDDVWSFTEVDWWTNLRSMLKENSCIIITTRHEDAAINMGVKNSCIHRLQTLNDEDSWCLFSKFAFTFSSGKGLGSTKPSGKLEKELLKKCDGLPLAIKTIGMVASTMNSRSQWSQFLRSFHALTTQGGASSLMASLRLSYDELPHYLKQCLLCFSIYPEGFEIRADQLIHWWIGEGLVLGKESKTAVEVGYEYLAKLISRCLVETVQPRGFNGRVYKCKIRDMVRELIILIAEEGEFCTFNEGGKQKLTAKTRWLCFIDEMQEESFKCSKLRALLLMSRCQFDFDRNSVFLRSLRMLDLSNCTVDESCVNDLFKRISSLKRLASLNLSGVQALKEVPSSIHKLLNLQLLVLTGCSNLGRIHPSITNLKKLIILDLRRCPRQSLPQGLGRASQLQELSGFKVGSRPRNLCFQLLEIKELIELRVLRMHVSASTVIVDDELDVLSHLKRLKVLDIDAEDCENEEVLEMLDKLTPPPDLEELCLRNYKKDTLPNWVNPEQLSTLRYLCIENCDLINLSSSHPTWNIEGLCLKYLEKLKVDWKDLKMYMPQLQYMEINHCDNLKDYPCSELGVWIKSQH